MSISDQNEINTISVSMDDDIPDGDTLIIDKLPLSGEGIDKTFEYKGHSIQIRGGVNDNALSLWLVLNGVQQLLVMGRFSAIGPSVFTQRITDSIYCQIYVNT